MQRMSWWQSKIGHLTIAEIDEDHIFYAIEELQDRKPRYYAGKDADGNRIYKSKNKPYSAATINRYVAAAAALFTWCIKKRLTPKAWVNPCKGIEKIPENNEVVRFLSEADKTAKLKFSPKAARWISGESWHPEQRSHFEKDGSFVLEFEYSQDPELIMDILKHGDEVEVLAPTDLKKKIIEKLKKSLINYQD